MSERVLRLTSQLLNKTAPPRCIDEPTLDAFQDWGIEGIISLDSEPGLHVDGAVLRRAHAMGLRTTDERSRIIATATEALATLATHGVIATPFKGLSTERYYPDDVRRWYGDADLYISDPAAGDLVQGLRSIGLAETGAASVVKLATAQRLSGIELFNGGIGLDIHFVPTSQFFQAAASTPSAFLGDSQLLSLPGSRAPSAEFDLLVAAVNSVRDAGRSLKAAVDVVYIVHQAHDRIDWNVFDQLVTHFEMQNVVRPAIATIEHQLEIDIQQKLDRAVAPLAGFGLLHAPSFWTRKRSNLLNLYFGPNRAQAGIAALRWIAPSITRMRAEGDVTVDADHLSRTDLWRDRWRRVRAN